jgi:hypothetical protein
MGFLITQSKINFNLLLELLFTVRVKTDTAANLHYMQNAYYHLIF